ncbi:histidine phosphatase family protein [Arsukibacterium indicum]|uniref:Histidine phosphatase family protein n=1 Tax=Arsukibacterium indicum TaxID=2848612 RepID=A0ABS6MKB2_9GAMM|nr:histidine phosphatase family protein [Arsukibacterium indicum]MBV2129262.1 histidine phosphatase family protein [Arsukibacterium indicum]
MRTLMLLLGLLPVLCTANDAAWQAWRDGRAVLIMRHALAPGTGDPAGFVLTDCKTQRNLNAAGRQQAQKWGEVLRQQTSADIALYSSQWCRCLDTARLMNIASVQPLPALNSFFAGRGDRQQQTDALLAQFAVAKLPEPTVLVSHQVNFTALTGYFPASGEAAILALPLTAPATVLARIAP